MGRRSTLLGGDNIMVSQLTSWQAHQDGESEDSSFTSSSMSNFKSPSASLNEIDEYMCMLAEGGAGHANEYHDEMSYQRLPNLLEQPLLSIANTSITKDHYPIKHEEAIKNTIFFNPLDPKTLPFPLDFYHHAKANSTLAPSFMRSVEQAYDQTLHIDHAQVPLKSDYALLHDPSSSPSPFVSTSDDSYSKHVLDNYGARQARKNLNVECPITQPSNEVLETTSNGPYNVPYLPCGSFTTSPTVPSIISTNSSPITSLASHTSTIADTASMDAASLPPDHCQDNLFVNGSEMMSSLITLHTRSSMTRTSKGKNVEIDKVIKKKRKRTRSRKNSEELESQRMTHIAVERNRRRQMNQHLNDLRSLMPSSYIQRGDQASIVGGAIRLVEELEQVLESLHLRKQITGGASNQQVPLSHLDDDKGVSISNNEEAYACLQTSMVNVQVEMISLSSILVKVMAPKRHHQLLHILQALSFLSLKVLHLNITTFDISILYSFNLKMENDCQFQTALQLAKSIQHVFDNPNMESHCVDPPPLE